MTAVGKIFADYVSSSRFEELPQEVRQEGRRAFAEKRAPRFTGK